ncbi:hypothetical protein T492DRAFT_875664 [Pavlovales sp. CCMP2436]|nr:hypothetical protein T492DRAFT_875664 [Pavlovales sp. CCMP2436]
MRKVASFYNAPVTKFVLRMLGYSLFLLQYALVLVQDDGTPDFSLTFFFRVGAGARD